MKRKARVVCRQLESGVFVPSGEVAAKQFHRLLDYIQLSETRRNNNKPRDARAVCVKFRKRKRTYFDAKTDNRDRQVAVSCSSFKNGFLICSCDVSGGGYIYV